ncbi:MAG: PilZ domain-containing protein [Magnetococcales bacterium]|nr:PilZ domain-containing protein [Magnetococcales bacterium]
MSFSSGSFTLSSDKYEERRVSARICRSRQVTLELSNNRTVLGLTENVSRSGAFVRIESPMWSLAPGAVGQLRLLDKSVVAPWPCRLVRANRSGVGIEILDDTAHFLSAWGLSLHPPVVS